VKQAFGQMVAIEYFLLVFAFVFYFKGKQIRRWTASYGPLKWQNDAIISVQAVKTSV
jgi:predicted PurR-regulated permease PerM